MLTKHLLFVRAHAGFLSTSLMLQELGTGWNICSTHIILFNHLCVREKEGGASHICTMTLSLISPMGQVSSLQK